MRVVCTIKACFINDLQDWFLFYLNIFAAKVQHDVKLEVSPTFQIWCLFFFLESWVSVLQDKGNKNPTNRLDQKYFDNLTSIYSSINTHFLQNSHSCYYFRLSIEPLFQSIHSLSWVKFDIGYFVRDTKSDLITCFPLSLKLSPQWLLLSLNRSECMKLITRATDP